jgi:hypothetical protein
MTNRTIPVTSPYTGHTYMVAHYAVNNSAPRPEVCPALHVLVIRLRKLQGYAEDFATAMGASPALNDSARADLYAELASGAETGWDYSARWVKQPVINVSDNNPALRTLNTRAIIPVDLNSLLSGDHSVVSSYCADWDELIETSSPISTRRMVPCPARTALSSPILPHKPHTTAKSLPTCPLLSSTSTGTR